MTIKKKQFRAHLIKYRHEEGTNIWFWVNPNSGSPISPQFDSQKEAEKWFDDIMQIHNETYDLLDRVKNGRFYRLRGRIDVGDVISSVKSSDCPFTVHLEDDILEADILAISRTDAKARLESYFEILEWIE